MTRVPVLSGPLEERGLTDVLEAMSLTRQLSCVEVASPLGAHEGAIWLKSGQLLEITAGARSGLDALGYLLDRKGTYNVFRAEGKIDGSVKPMMSIGAALAEAANASAAPTSVGWSTGMQAVSSLGASDALPPSLRSNGGPGPALGDALDMEAQRPTPRPISQPAASTRPTAPVRPTLAPVRPAPAAAAPAASPTSPTSPASPASSRAPQSQAPTWIGAAGHPVPASVRGGPRPSRSGPVLTIFANKGGVGKTTFSVNLAVTLARRGMRVHLVDADPRNDVGNSIAAQRDTSVGLFDVLDGSVPLRDALLETALPGLTILPAGGVNLTEDRFQAASSRADGLATVLASLSGAGSIVIVDTPPGLRGITRSALRASSHAVVMVQAEPIAVRAAAMVQRALAALPDAERPSLAGVVLNMLDRRVGASLGMLEEVCQIFGADAVLDIAIPRSGAFIEASERGAPVALLDGESSHAVGWIFESLASAILARAGLATPKFAELRLL